MNITQPTFLIDEYKCRENIAKMSLKAKKTNCIFRPHFKTHQSALIGEWFRESGVRCITVSSVGMAQYFASHNWNDILIAFPFNVHETHKINNLPAEVDIHLTVESVFTVKYLLKHLKRPAGIYIKVDAGYHRTGLTIDQVSTISEIVDTCNHAANLVFKGFLAHFGNTYQVGDTLGVKTIYSASMQPLLLLKKQFQNMFPHLLISVGDTPSCSILNEFPEADEIRPGNFVFYDLMQLHSGSCSFSEIGAIVACPVVAKHASRLELVLYGGAVHLSKDFIKDDKGEAFFGRVVKLDKAGWTSPIPGARVSRISQEHGIVTCTDDFFEQVKEGDILGVVPVHSCLTANLHKTYLTTQGKTIRNIHSNW